MFFIKNRVFSIVINLLICALGVISFFQLPVREYTKLSKPIIEVRLENPGASCDLLKNTIYRPFAEHAAGLPGLKGTKIHLNSGQFKAELEFEAGTKPFEALLLVMQAVNEAQSNFPPNLKPAVVSIAEDSRAGTIAFGLIPKDNAEYDTQYLAELMYRYIKTPIENIKGVANFKVYGAMGDLNRLAIDVTMDPCKMRALKITPIDVMNSIQTCNFIQPAGTFIGINQCITVQLLGDLHSVGEFANMPISHDSNSKNIIRLRDVAHVQLNDLNNPENAVEKEMRTCYNKRNIGYADVQLQQDSNILYVSRALQEKLPLLQAAIPDQNLELKILSNNADSVEASINRVYRTLVEAIILVIIVVALFLGSIRLSIVPIIAIPICITSSFLFMYFFGFTINILTLASIVLGCGLFVDDCIVAVHAIDDKRKLGLNLYDACVEGMKHVQFSIIGMTLTLVAVYLPIGFVRGEIGSNFFEFAVTLSCMIIVSGIVAITLTPIIMLSPIIGDSYHEYNEVEYSADDPWLKKIFGFTNNAINNVMQNFHDLFEQLQVKYSNLLSIALNNSLTVLLISLCFCGTSLLLVKNGLKQVMSPHQDKNQAFLMIQFPGRVRLVALEKLFNDIEDEVLKHSEVLNILSTYSVGELYTIKMYLTDLTKRSISDEEIASQIEKKIRDQFANRIMHAKGSFDAFISEDPGFRILIQTPDSIDALRKILPEFTKLFKDLPANNGVRFSNLEPEENYAIYPNYHNIMAFGVSLDTVMKSVQFIMTGNPPATHYTVNGVRYPVRCWTSFHDRKLRVISSAVKTMKPVFDQFYVRSSHRNEKGEFLLYLLSELITIEKSDACLTQTLQDGLYTCEISTQFIDPNIDHNVIYDRLVKMAHPTLPNNIQIRPGEAIQKVKDNSGVIVQIFSIAVVFMYLFTSVLFESFTLPFIILATAPLGISGGLLFLYFSHNGSLNIWSYIALLTLIGLITKHGILIVDEYRKYLDEDKTPKESALLAGVSRFKPIVMTTLAMVLGAVPLMLGHGSGYEVMEQIGIVIVGGLLIGTFITIFLVPSLCLIYSTITVKNNLSIEE